MIDYKQEPFHSLPLPVKLLSVETEERTTQMLLSEMEHLW